MIRTGVEADLPEIARIQAASPEAAQWVPTTEELLVAVEDNCVAGFLAWRRLADAESEILNLAVDPEFRRKGIAKALVTLLRQIAPGGIYLEVRERNRAAIQLYKSLGFELLNKREQYYDEPRDSAVVMVWRSC
jgi:[ribosomal protein S18]-alanine N-acetyltransferase